MHAILFILAVLPGILICLYIYTMDKYEKESRLHLAISFGLGMLATLPVRNIESWSTSHGWDDPRSILLSLFSSFIAVALSEELVKFIALMVFPFPRSFFNEPFDGIVYAVMIGMGFATLENVWYASHYGLETIILRAFTAIPAHGAFAVVMGYYIGKAKFSPTRRIPLILTGLAVPVILHGLYDFFILQEAIEWLIIFAVITLVLSVNYARTLIKDHQENSPFRKE